jgi:LssY C-terminus
MENQNMQKILIIMIKRSISVGLTIPFALFMVSCATFKKPASINEVPVYERALTIENNGIRVSAAVLGDEEARQIFGIDLAGKKIQAVWVEIENNTDRPIFLLPIAIDPEYFAPLEVAYAYHKAFATEANTALNEHLLKLNFPIRSPVTRGSRASGYIFTNWTKGMKVIDVDLLSDDFSQNFTFFAPNPDWSAGPNAINRFETMYSDSELQKIEGEDELRQVLELLPCCVSMENGGSLAEPLNVVIIGAIDDWSTAFVRRGYVLHMLNPRYAFGRAQDLVCKKQNRGYTKAQAHTIRFWVTPIRYRDKPVWVAQIGTLLGGRFAEGASAEASQSLDPYVDDARYDLTQDLAYSQALLKIGFVKGSGRPQSPPVEQSSGDIDYTTDGLRAVLVFAERPASLADIDFFDWERLADD